MLGLVTATWRSIQTEESRVKSRLGSGGMTKLRGGASRATTPLRSSRWGLAPATSSYDSPAVSTSASCGAATATAGTRPSTGASAGPTCCGATVAASTSLRAISESRAAASRSNR